MSLAISSAIPNDLSRYSTVGSRLNAELLSEAGYLAGVLSHFEATCREPGYALRVSHLADELRGYARQTDLLDRWVGVVGIGFFAADSGRRIITWAERVVGGVLMVSVARGGRYLNISLGWVRTFGLTPSGVRTFLGITATRIRFENLLKYWDKVIGKAALFLLIAIKWAEDFRDYTGTQLISALAVDAIFAVIVVKVAAGVGALILGALAGASLPAIVIGALVVGAAIAVAWILDSAFEGLGIRDWAINALDTAINWVVGAIDTAVTWTMDRVSELPELGARTVRALDENIFMPIARGIATGVDNVTSFVDSAAQRLRQKLQDTADAAGRVISDKAIKPTSGEALELRQSLHDAMDGWGTDENAIFSLLAKASSTEIQAILNDTVLMERLNKELGSKEMEYVRHTALSGQPTFPRDDFSRGIRYDEISGDLFNPGSDGQDVHPNDVRQGTLGDCYLIASLAELALQHPDLIHNMVAANEDGTYTVTLYDESINEYVEVRVSNMFPTDSGSPYYAKISDDGELWPAVIEKAYAQYFGPSSYESIEGGLAGIALQRLTGGQIAIYYDADQMELTFDSFADHFTNGDAIAVGGATENDLDVLQRHAYYVVAVDRDHRTVTIRNPWGYRYEPIIMTWKQFIDTFGHVDITSVPT